MIARRIQEVKKDSPEWIKQLEGRLFIRMDKHRIILPNEKYKRIYLSKKRTRLLEANTLKFWEFAFEDTWYYHNHAPKAIKEYADQHREPKPIPKPQHAIIKEIKKSWWKKLFN